MIATIASLGVFVLGIIWAIYNSYATNKDKVLASRFRSRRSNLTWGGVPVDYRSPIDHTYGSEALGYLPVTNSMKAIERIQAEHNTPPWSDDRGAAGVDDSTDATAIHMRKQGKAQDTFQKGKIRSPTATRGMSV